MPEPESFIPLKPVVLHILLALTDRPRHGYAIIQSIRDRTEGRIRVHTGPLYRHLRRLLDDELVEDSERAPEGVEDDTRRGAYYGLTPLGRRVLSQELRRLDRVLALGRDLGAV